MGVSVLCSAGAAFALVPWKPHARDDLRWITSEATRLAAKHVFILKQVCALWFVFAYVYVHLRGGCARVKERQ